MADKSPEIPDEVVVFICQCGELFPPNDHTCQPRLKIGKPREVR